MDQGVSPNGGSVVSRRHRKGRLTPKQELFARAVAIKRMNYSDAYRHAFNTRTTNQNTIWCTAYQIRSYPQVANRIKELQEQSAKRLLLNRQQYLEKLEGMALADVREMFNPQGELKPIEELTEEQADLIEGLDVVENFQKVGDKAEHVGYTKKLKLASKRAILKDYGEARGWLEAQEESGPRRLVVRRYEKWEVHVNANSTDHHGTVIDVSRNGHSGDGIRAITEGTGADRSAGGADPSDSGANGTPA